MKETPLALVTKLKINTPDVAKHLDWLSRLMMLGVESSGVLSAEIFPPYASGDSEWTLVQRFYTQEELDEWLKSNPRKQLMDEMAPYLENKEVSLTESVDSKYAGGGSVSVAVVTHVKEGHEKAYFAYEGKYQAAQARAPGYHGAYVQPPISGNSGIWITIIRFDSTKAMEEWFASENRRKLVEDSSALVNSTDFTNVTTSFPGWFPTVGNARKGPPNWKAALLILLGLYPSVVLVIKYLMPFMREIHPALSNFMGNILTVAFTTWMTMPLFIKVYDGWLFPTEKTPKWVAPVSLLSIIIFLALEVLFFWRFF